MASGKQGNGASRRQKSVRIPADSATLEGDLALPEGTGAVVVFAHGSGSSRLSPRNRYVAEVLQKAGIGTLLFDLLTRKEDEIYETRFDIPLLIERLKAATVWLKKQPECEGLKIGYFGASTGTAAAIGAAAGLGEAIGAIVSRGGRPDLAMDYLSEITAPTLLIVGSLDHIVIGMNETAYRLISAPKELSIVKGASHLFEEPGTLEEVARLAAEWFKQHLL